MARVELKPGAIPRLTNDMVTTYHRVRAPLIMVLMKIEAPYDTGQLRASGIVDPTIYRDGATRIIRFKFPATSANGFEYAQAVFAGRREVRPVQRQALRWVTSAGVVVFAKRSRAVPPNRWTLRVFARLGFRDVKVGVR